MKRYQLIAHTADTGLVAYGQSLSEAFANAGYGLFSVMADLRKVKEVESREVTASAEDVESLLFEWLNALIFLFDVSGFLCKRFDVSEFTESSLKATCWGEKYDPSRHQLKLGVKSATYHMLEVNRQKNRVRVILDV